MLRKNAGHGVAPDFSPGPQKNEREWASQAAGKLKHLKGTGFSPYVTTVESTWL